jgi:hypothetical protein
MGVRWELLGNKKYFYGITSIFEKKIFFGNSSGIKIITCNHFDTDIPNLQASLILELGNIA